MNFKSQHHSFDIELAKIYGIEEAILIHHFQHWIQINHNAKRNFIDGRNWTYQTLESIAEHFPYLSIDQVRTILKKLCEGKTRFQKETSFEPVLIKGNFNKVKYDQTKWYAFADQEKFTTWCKHQIDPVDRSQIDPVEPPNEKGGYTGPIPDTKPDAKTKEEARNKVPPSEPAFRLSFLLNQKIKERDPGFKEPNFKKWAIELDRMHKVDKRSWEEIESMILISQENEFWRGNIHCTTKIRKHASKLKELLLKKDLMKEEEMPEIYIDRAKEALKSKYGHLPMSCLRKWDNRVEIKINGAWCPIKYGEHGFMEQLESALRKGGHI